MLFTGDAGMEQRFRPFAPVRCHDNQINVKKFRLVSDPCGVARKRRTSS